MTAKINFSCFGGFRNGILLLALVFLVNGIGYGQKPKKCKIEKDKTLAKYKIEDFERGNANALILHISLNPNDITDSSLVSIAKQLKILYCKEKIIIATFFDDREAARNATLNSIDIFFERTLESSRGGYYLNRNTGEEFVSYSNTGGFLRTGTSKTKIIIGEKR